ncbi:hypothetical protein B0H65DRAFT_41053 [Neurospora tetraspora]|uniref:Uncharacterized protein n=1 Tax=Neurospora tetraspora TaxID=94610 RepID=A0AAE0MXM5_9PEZI|nr:hypothetical protein B0H65DRAFT_41053 [Neurospora tetraspora]
MCRNPHSTTLTVDYTHPFVPRTNHFSSLRYLITQINPFVRLGALVMLLFLFGISITPSILSFVNVLLPLMLPYTLPATLLPAPPPPPPIAEPFSILRFFHPSSSRSSLSAFSFSSRSSRSARRADSSLADSDDCSSSMVLSSLSTLSRMRPTSSWSCVFCLSLRSIWDCRSLTMRSTLRTERWDLLRSVSCSSSWDSSWRDGLALDLLKVITSNNLPP